MIKVIGLLTRKAGLTHREFSDYWHNVHAPLGDRIVPDDAKSDRYIQSHALIGADGSAPYDAVAELAFADKAGMQRWIDWYNSDAGKPLRDDEQNFMDVAKRIVIVTDERMMRDNLTGRTA